MEPIEQKRFEQLYQKHLTNLKLQGKRPSTIDLYSRPIRRLARFFDRCPDTLTADDLKNLLRSPGANPFLEHRQNRSQWYSVFLEVCS